MKTTWIKSLIRRSKCPSRCAAKFFYIATLWGIAICLSAATPTPLNGNLSGNLTLAGSPYLATGNLFVAQGQSLVIEAGTVLQFQSTNLALYVDGTLIARSPIDNPIVFTSDQTPRQSGQWGGIIFRSTADQTNTVLDGCIIEAAGSSAVGNEAILFNFASCTLTNCTIRGNRGNGITFLGSNAKVGKCQLLGNTGYAMAMRTDSFAQLSSNTATGNNTDAIAVFSSDVAHSGHWVRDNPPYTLLNSVVVDQGVTLTIDPGVIIQFQNTNIAFVVDGTLSARTSADNPILFTSDKPVKQPGQWGSLIFRSTANPTNTILDGCVIEAAGSPAVGNEAILFSFASCTLTNCSIRGNKGSGITFLGSDASVGHCQFLANTGYAMGMRSDSFPRLSNNSATGNNTDAIAVFSSDVNHSGHWVRDNLPYTLLNSLAINQQVTLTIDPSVIVQFQNTNIALYIDGTLIARSPASNPILFTSDKAAKQPGQWGSLIFRSTTDSTNTVMDGCLIEAGGSPAIGGEAVLFNSGSCAVTNCTIRGNMGNGITFLSSDARVGNCQFLTNTGFAMAMRSDSFPQLSHNTATGNNADAIAVFSSEVGHSGHWVRDNLPYTLVQTLAVNRGVTLTIDPAVTVQFQNTNIALYVDGTLIARSSTNTPILFTSDKPIKQPGQWGSLVFRSTADPTNTVLDGCVIEAAGSPAVGNEAILFSFASCTLTNCSIRGNKGSGITFLGSDASVGHCQFLANTGYAMGMRSDSFPRLSNNSATGNNTDAIAVFSSDVNHSGHWVRDNLPYTLLNSLAIDQQVTLTIDPSVIVQFQNTNIALYIDGAVIARSSTNNPILFTSDKPIKQPGQWGSLIFRSTADPTNTVLDGCIIEAAGSPAVGGEAILFNFGSCTVTNCVIRGNKGSGITFLGSNARVGNCQFLTNSGFAMGMRSDSFAQLSNNTAKGNNADAIAIFSSDVSHSGRWVRDNPPYTLINSVVVDQGVTLTIDPGVIVQFLNADTALYVDGTLNASGTVSLPIRFTSNKSVKQPGQWNQLIFRAGSGSNSLLNYCVIEYGGQAAEGSLVLSSASPRVMNTIINNSASDGINCSGSASPLFTNCRITSNARDGIRSSLGATPILTNSVVAGNTGLGANNLDTTRIVLAEGNYWGDPSGPFDNSNADGKNLLNPKGLGSKVSEYVDWGRFLATDPLVSLSTPIINIASSTLNFGSVSVGQTNDLTVGISNLGSAPLTVSSLSISNSAFRLLSPAGAFTVTSGSSQNVTVRFMPAVGGSQVGQLQIASNDPNQPNVTVTLQGSGLSSTPGIFFSDSFNRADADRCSLGQADLALGGSGIHFYLPLFPTNGTDSSKPIGANIAANTLQNNGLDFGGIQFATASGACADGTIRGANIGQDFNFKVSLLVPSDPAGHITRAGPYFRSRAAARGEGIIGGTSSGYWVQLLSTGAIQIKQLNPQAVIADSQRQTPFDSTIFHTLEMAVQGAALQVAVDGILRSFNQNGVVVTNIAISGSTANDGTAGIAFGAEDNRGLIGGQRADFFLLSAFNALAGLPSDLTPPRIHVIPDRLDFGEVKLGQSSDLFISIQNNGGATLNVTGLAPDAPQFALVAPAVPFAVQAGAEQFVTIRFQPSSTNPATSTLSINSNDPSQPLVTIPLFGSMPSPITAPPFLLDIMPIGADLLLSWPSSFKSVSLETTESLSPPILWRSTTNSGLLVGNRLQIRLSRGPKTEFFRLSQTIAPFSVTLTNLAIALGQLNQIPIDGSAVQFETRVAQEMDLVTQLTDQFDLSIDEAARGVSAFASLLDPTLASLVGLRLSQSSSFAALSSNPLSDAVDYFKMIQEAADQLKKANGKLKEADQIIKLLAGDFEFKSLETIASEHSSFFKEIAGVFKKMRDGVEAPLDEMISGKNAQLPDDVADYSALVDFVGANDPGLAKLMQAPNFTIDSYRRLVLTDRQRDLVAQGFRSSTLRGRLYLRDNLLGFLKTLASAGVETYMDFVIEASGPAGDVARKVKSAAEFTQKIYDFLTEGATVPKTKLQFRSRKRFLSSADSSSDVKADLFLTANLPNQTTRLATLLVDGQNIINEKGDLLLTLGIDVPALSYDVLVIPRDQENQPFKLLPFARTFDANLTTFLDLPLLYATKIKVQLAAKRKDASGGFQDALLTLDQEKNLLVTVEGFPQTADGPIGGFFDSELRPDGSTHGFYVLPFVPPTVPLTLKISGPDTEDFSQTFTIAQPESEMGVTLLLKSTAGAQFTRQDPPHIRIDSPTSGFGGDIVVTNTGAYVTDSAGVLGLNWPLPPTVLVAGQTFQMTITPAPTTAKARREVSNTSPAVPRSLKGDINQIVDMFATEFAFIGYNDIDPQCTSGSTCYLLGQRPITRSISLDPSLTGFTLTISLAAYGGLTFGGNGERTASVTWIYVRK